jgi:2-methylisocitrate lyase-like PEP mutase family enzyme
MTTTPLERRERFLAMHQSGVFVLPNPYDIGTARLLAAQGFEALATTSAGFAATLGRLDMQITRDELIAHTRVMAAATDLPLNVDAERCNFWPMRVLPDSRSRIGTRPPTRSTRSTLPPSE